MSRIGKRKRNAEERLAEVDISKANGARMYMDMPGFNVETFRDYCAMALLPMQSVFFAKAAAGDYTSAIRIVRTVFPDAEWCIDSGGADLCVGDVEFDNEDGSMPSRALVRCVLDAIIYFAGGK